MTTVLCGVLAVGGCSTTESGNAQPSTTTDLAAATAALWDPCSEIPDSTLTGLGLDVTSKRSGILGAEEPGWKICLWDDAEYPSTFGVSVGSTVHTVDEATADSNNIDIEDISVAGRQGVQFRQSNYDADEECNFAFATSTGSVEFGIINTSSKSKSVAPCDRLRPMAEAIVPSLP
ncbi:MAG: DUF3558 domain-containing protein, partial [Streptomyces sp.]|nr:DUF3558 domain-containing protein [Streptomyces sp.]